MRKIQVRIGKQQKGLTLLLVLVLLVVTISSSLFFQERMTASTRISGATRDNSVSLILAESAMENLRGGFINDYPLSDTSPPYPLYALDSRDCTWNLAHDVATGIDAAACQADPRPDVLRVADIGGLMSDTVALETSLGAADVGYIYYVGAADQVLPNLLQRVANAGAGVTGTGCTIETGTHSVSEAECNLDISTLFGGTNYSPLAFTTSEGLLFKVEDPENWQAVLDQADNYDGTVAAAWLELTVNTENPDAVDVWVQAVASVGIATSYVQRNAGTYHPASNVLGSLAGLVESSNIDRRLSP